MARFIYISLFVFYILFEIKVHGQEFDGHRIVKRQSITIISCADNNANCVLFKSYCSNRFAKYLNYAISDLCQATCKKCSGTTTKAGTTTTTATPTTTITTTTTTSTTSTTSTTTTTTTTATTITTTSTITTSTATDTASVTTDTASVTTSTASTSPSTDSNVSSISTSTAVGITVTQDACRFSPCLNGGECFSLGLSYICVCIGYVGDKCQFVDPCAVSPCQQDASCKVLLYPSQADYYCQCTGLSYGKNCSKNFTTSDCYDASPYCLGLTQTNCTSRVTIIGVPVREACTKTCTGCTPGTTASGQTTQTTQSLSSATTTKPSTAPCVDLLTNCEVMKFYCTKRNAVLTYNGVSVPFKTLCASTCQSC